MVNDFDKALKVRLLRSVVFSLLYAQCASQEVGDFENWVKVMEWDMQSVATALEAATQAGGTPEKAAAPEGRR